MKMAPTLAWWLPKWGGTPEAKELRALLAVARAARAMGFTPRDETTTLAYTGDVDSLKKALARLSRVSSPRSRGRR